MSSSRAALVKVILGAFVFTGFSAVANEVVVSRLGTPRSIEQVRTIAQTGEYVTIEGSIVRKRSEKLFELEDHTGLMTVVIPEHLRRELGEPQLYERIRVQGKYDHKPLYNAVEHPEDSWGIRVQGLERKVAERRAPRPADSAEVPALTPRPASPPAAAEGPVEVMTSNLDEETRERLQSAAKRVRTAEKALAEVDAEYARALHQRGELEAGERSAFDARRADAQAELREARAAIPPLAEEARAAGLSEKIVETYEQRYSSP